MSGKNEKRKCRKEEGGRSGGGRGEEGGKGEEKEEGEERGGDVFVPHSWRWWAAVCCGVCGGVGAHQDDGALEAAMRQRQSRVQGACDTTRAAMRKKPKKKMKKKTFNNKITNRALGGKDRQTEKRKKSRVRAEACGPVCHSLMFTMTFDDVSTAVP